MNSLKDAALRFAAKGKPVFPCHPETKRPLTPHGFKDASNDAAKIRRWWDQNPSAMIGMPTGPASGFWAVDLDGQEGLDNWAALLVKHGWLEDLPETASQATPSGGMHLLFSWEEALDIRNSESQLAPKIDVRGDGGYIIVAPSRRADGREYRISSAAKPAKAPGWLLELVGKPAAKKRKELPAPASRPGDTTAYGRAALEQEIGKVAVAPEGQRNRALNDAAFALGQLVAGGEVDEGTALAALQRAGRAAGLTEDEIPATILSGFESGQKEPRSAPAGDGDDYAELIAEMNQQFALTTHRGRVLFALDDPGRPVEFLRRADFLSLTANKLIAVGEGKVKSAGWLWERSPLRREAREVVFDPSASGEQQDVVNLWRGFALKPLDCELDEMAARCALYRQHVEEIICGGDPTLIRYTWAWLSDLVKHPGGEKPGVAVVLRGGRGAGKGAFVKPLLDIFGQHGLQLNDRTRLTGRFNGRLATAVLCFADEAFWAADKAAEGVLKGLVTESRMEIEQKGLEAFQVRSHHRIIMASNESWVAPAGPDERRFLVLDVSEERKQDASYFGPLFRELEQGGAEALLGWLLAYDGSSVDLRKAPTTAALIEQKVESLEPVHAWWLDQLRAGKLGGLFVTEEWPEETTPGELHEIFSRWCREHRRFPATMHAFSRVLFASELAGPKKRVRVRTDKGLGWTRKLWPLDEARVRFEEFIGGKSLWD